MKYPSKYSNGKSVTAAQFITEIICENKAKIDKKDLYYRFWTTNEWEKFYKNQIATAIKLLKKYPEKAIIRALSHQKASRIFSLRAPHLIPIIEEQEKLLSEENSSLSQQYDRSSKTFGNNGRKANSVLSKLKELE